jgi:hypothetical protein
MDILSPDVPSIPTIQKVIAVLWPSFLVSGIASVLFFTAFDPVELLSTDISRIGAYSIGFFLFWLMTMASSLLTLYFQLPIITSKEMAYLKAKKTKTQEVN